MSLFHPLIRGGLRLVSHIHSSRIDENCIDEHGENYDSDSSSESRAGWINKSVNENEVCDNLEKRIDSDECVYATYAENQVKNLHRMLYAYRESETIIDLNGKSHTVYFDLSDDGNCKHNDDVHSLACRIIKFDQVNYLEGCSSSLVYQWPFDRTIALTFVNFFLMGLMSEIPDEITIEHLKRLDLPAEKRLIARDQILRQQLAHVYEISL